MISLRIFLSIRLCQIGNYDNPNLHTRTMRAFCKYGMVKFNNLNLAGLINYFLTISLEICLENGFEEKSGTVMEIK